MKIRRSDLIGLTMRVLGSDSLCGLLVLCLAEEDKKVTFNGPNKLSSDKLLHILWLTRSVFGL